MGKRRNFLKIQNFLEESGLNRIPMMLSFFGKWLPLYGIGALAAASKGLLSNLFAGQLYAVLTMAAVSLEQFAAGFLRVLLLLVAVTAVTGGGTILYLWTTAKADFHLRMTLTNHIMHLSVGEWVKRHSSDWLNVTGRDADDASAIYKEQSQRLLGAVLSIAGGLVIMVQTSVSFAAFAVGVGFLYMGIGVYRSKLRKKQETLLRGMSVELTQQISDFISGSRAARFYEIREFLHQRHEEKRREVDVQSKKIARVISVNSGFSSLGYTISYSGALIFGLLMVNWGNMTLPGMLALWPLSMGVTFGIIDFGFFLSDFQPSAAAADRVREVLMLQTEQGGVKESCGVMEPECLMTLGGERGMAVEFDHVTFSYGKEPVLRDICLTVAPGEKIALVGGSGSGKSTLMKLLLRFYEPDSGEVRVFGVRAADYSLKGLRSQISYVPQTAVLYSGTVEDNLKLVCPDAHESQLREALCCAGAEELLTSLPQGLLTWVGEGGSRLSGGQRQRLAVARAFLKRAPVMIFDEATAALDGGTETAITDALRGLPADQTLLLVTHRLSTALLAQRIVVLEDGVIAETGSHEELLEQNGVYAKLWELR